MALTDLTNKSLLHNSQPPQALSLLLAVLKIDAMIPSSSGLLIVLSLSLAYKTDERKSLWIS
uniref:Uncharacterized protein n=1 Tax=Oryza meridionalis TaxID=40149 RepID=A0A0E0E268_9ORYZ